MIEYIKSAYEVRGIAFDAAKFILEDVLDVMAGIPAKADSWLADYGNEEIQP